MTGFALGTVMIVDDEQSDREQFRRTLLRSGMAADFVPFGDAEMALDWLRSDPDARIDLVLLDVNMPRMTGLEFLEQADERLRGMKAVVAIMLTTPLMPADLARAQAFNSVQAFLEKPLTRAHLDAVARLLSERRS